MKDKSQITLSQHQSNAVKARWAKTSSEERSAHAKKMVEAREAKRAEKKLRPTFPSAIEGTFNEDSTVSNKA